MVPIQVLNGNGVRTNMSKKKHCDYCEEDVLISGVHFPSDFDDRESCHDGKVFMAKCDACWNNQNKPNYDNDHDAAEQIAKVTGWKILWSKDCDDALDPEERKEAAGKLWARPYFAVTLAEAEEVMSRKET